MKNRNIIAIGLALLTVIGAHFVFDIGTADATTCLGGGSGGTGICNATSQNIGQAIIVTSTLTIGTTTIPVYAYGTVSGGGGSSTPLTGTPTYFFYANASGTATNASSAISRDPSTTAITIGNAQPFDTPGFDSVNIADSLGINDHADSQNHFVEITPNTVYIQKTVDDGQPAFQAYTDNGNANVGADFTNTGNGRSEFHFSAGSISNPATSGDFTWTIVPQDGDFSNGSFSLINGNSTAGYPNFNNITIKRNDGIFLNPRNGGNVSIGSFSDPTHKFEVHNSGSGSDVAAYYNGTIDGYSDNGFFDYQGVDHLWIGYGNPSATAPFGGHNYLQNVGTDLYLLGGAAGDQVNTVFTNAGKVGIGTSTPVTPLSVVGAISQTNAKNALALLSSSGTINAYAGASACGGIGAVTAISATGVTTCGAFVTTSTDGTANTVPLWIAANTLGNSVISQSGTRIGVNSTTPQSTFVVQGSASTSTVPFSVASSTGARLVNVLGNGQLQIINGGDATNPAIFLGVNSGRGIALLGTDNIAFSTGGAANFVVNGNGTFVDRTKVLGFTDGTGINSGTNSDTALSRLSADKVAVGNGTQGDVSGTFVAANIGIGSSTPQGLLAVVNASGTPALTVASTTNNSNALTVGGHIGFSSSSISINSCGSGASINGSDNGGLITTGGSTASCVINFAVAWVNNPVCTVTDASNAAALKIVTATSTFTLSMLSNFPTSTSVMYICQGNPN